MDTQRLIQDAEPSRLEDLRETSRVSWLEHDPDRFRILEHILNGESVWKASHLVHQSGTATRPTESCLYRVAQQVDGEVQRWLGRSTEEWLDEWDDKGELTDPPTAVLQVLRERCRGGAYAITEHRTYRKVD